MIVLPSSRTNDGRTNDSAPIFRDVKTVNVSRQYMRFNLVSKGIGRS